MEGFPSIGRLQLAPATREPHLLPGPHHSRIRASTGSCGGSLTLVSLSEPRPVAPAGVSVCLRYMTDFLQRNDATIFTISPSSSPLTLGVSYGSVYWLSSNQYGYNDQKQLVGSRGRRLKEEEEKSRRVLNESL